MTGDYTKSDIVDALRDVGIEQGDAIFIHSNLGFFGQLDNAETKKDYCETFYEAVFRVIGDQGTLVVPTFTYSFTDGDRFEPDATASDMGMFSEYVRTRNDSARSLDPNFSVAAVGQLAEPLTTDPPAHSFGTDSFWERFLAVQGKFCNFNMDAASTFLHYVERCLDVPYRWDKPFVGTIASGETEERRVFYHYVRDLNNEDHVPNFSAFDERASEEGVVERADLGKGQVVRVGAQDKYDVTEQAYLEDEAFLVTGTTDSV